MTTLISPTDGLSPVSYYSPLHNEPSQKAEEALDSKVPQDSTTISNTARQAGLKPVTVSDVVIDPVSVKDITALSESDTLQATASSGTCVSVTRNSPSNFSGKTDGVASKTDTIREASPAESQIFSYTVHLTGMDGKSLQIDFTDNIKIQENGEVGTSVYFSESNVTRTYLFDGTTTEAEGNTLEMDAASIFINTHAGSIETGNGDSLIFNWSDDTNISSGSGNDTIILHDDAKGINIETGEGDDIIIGKQITDSNISLGEGNNKVQAQGMENSTIEAGGGNNKISIVLPQGEQSYEQAGQFSHSTIILKDGDNFIQLGSIQDKSSILAGNGNNRLTSISVKYDSSVVMGDGDNTLDIHEVGEKYISSLSSTIYSTNKDLFHDNNAVPENSRVKLGNGNNTLSIYRVVGNSNILMGDGRNFAAINEINNSSTVSLGDGDNTVSLYMVSDDSELSLGDGNNSVRAYTTENNSHISMGNGNNALLLHEITDNSTVSFGHGNNNIGISEIQDRGNLSLGNGNNMYSIRGMRGSASLHTGNGHNLGLIGFMSYGSSASGSSNLIMSFLNFMERDSAIKQFQHAMEERTKNGLPTAGSSLEGLRVTSPREYREQIESEFSHMYPINNAGEDVDLSWQTSATWAAMMSNWEIGWSGLHIDQYI